MKKIYALIVLAAMSLVTFAQGKKEVAILDPICRDNSVSGLYLLTIRGAMESAVTASSEYEAYDRSALDQIQKEHSFQRTGAVSDSQIKEMGKMAAVDYVLVSEVRASEGYLSVVIKILNITTGKYDKSIDDVTELNPNAVKSKCREMASSLFGIQQGGALLDKEDEKDTVYVVVDSMPEFPGGEQALFKYLHRNLRYPVVAQENGTEGRVVCQFVVNKDGSIADEEIVRSSGDKSLDKEAWRLLQQMPRWKPGKRRGKVVRVKCTIPINFSLDKKIYTETAFGINMKMIWVEGGNFLMGCTSEQSDCANDEKTIRRVTIDGFYIGMLEVTQSQWEKVMGTSINQQWEKTDKSRHVYGVGPDFPMYFVNWEDAMEFCHLLSNKTGKTYTLPTEAQWEYAARGGKKADGTKYAGSNEIDAVAWCWGNSGEMYHKTAHLCGTKQANALGIHDMSGNVSEWCNDWYCRSYPSDSTINPTNPSGLGLRVFRGGNWYLDEYFCRITDRCHSRGTFSDNYIGFRVVCIP